MDNIILFAQALDNKSLDDLYLNNKIVGEKNREKYLNKIANISLDGKTVYVDNHNRVVILKKEYFIEIDIVEKDSLNRNSSIIACGNLPVSKNIEKYLKNFAILTKRSYNEKYFIKLINKINKNKVKILLIIGIIFTTIVATVLYNKHIPVQGV